MKTQTIFGTLAVLIPIGLALPQTTDTASFSADSIIERDVVIVGGGSSGAHAAVQIKDAGKKVIVIEKAGELGGHVKTYTAKSGVRVNYGPSNFQNYKAVQDFFGRFNIPLTKYVQPGSSDIYADFSTGKAVPNGTLPTPDFTAYLAQVNKYPWIGKSWAIPKPIPEDLLLPFGKFVEKYSLQNVAYSIAQFATGNGNVFDQPTIYIMKSVDADYIDSIVGGSAVAPASYDTHSLFERALTFLGSDVLLSSTVTSGTRSNKGIELIVSTPKGLKLIKAKKLLVTAPPKLNNLQPLGLDNKEQGIFSKLTSKALYLQLFDGTGLQTGVRYYNAKVSSDNYHVPKLPDTQFIWATKDTQTFWTWYSAPSELSKSTVEADVIGDVTKLGGGKKPNLLVSYDASPVSVSVTAAQIKAGFYDDLNSLQGYKNTWYTGSAWVSDHSAALWNNTNAVLLPALLA